jgi:uncharacterized protein YeaC (DUF1315 family)
MNIVDIVDDMSHEMYLRLKHAAETGKWPEGVAVEQAQRDNALQLSMAYQARHLNSDQMLTVGANGELVTKTKRELKAQFNDLTEQGEIQKCNKDDIARFTDL